MPLWKILTIGVLFCACFALMMATIVVPLSLQGAERWGWLGGLIAATTFMGTGLGMFLRYAERNMDAKTHGLRY